MLRARPLAIVPARPENAVTPDGASFGPAKTSGFLPSPTQPETLPLPLPVDWLHSEISDPDPDRILPPAPIV